METRKLLEQFGKTCLCGVALKSVCRGGGVSDTYRERPCKAAGLHLGRRGLTEPWVPLGWGRWWLGCRWPGADSGPWRRAFKIQSPDLLPGKD